MELKKPDPNKSVFQLFPEKLEKLKLIEEGRYPDCKEIILKDGSGRLWFRDQLSREEYGISGLCMKCQNEVFKEDM